MNQSQSNCSLFAIQTIAELAALFESEAEWEAAEQTRVLLYYWLHENRSAASRLLDALSAGRLECCAAAPNRTWKEIGLQMGKLACILNRLAAQDADEFAECGPLSPLEGDGESDGA